MLNVSTTKIEKNMKRYLTKNSVSGRYNRSKKTSQLLAVATAGEALRISSWDIQDISIISAMGTMLISSLQKMKNISRELQPIKTRAKQIKEAKHNYLNWLIKQTQT